MNKPGLSKKFEMNYTVTNHIGENYFMTRVRREKGRFFAERWGAQPLIGMEKIGDEKGYEIFEQADAIAKQEAERELVNAERAYEKQRAHQRRERQSKDFMTTEEFDQARVDKLENWGNCGGP
jgi:hypothetical protein